MPDELKEGSIGRPPEYSPFNEELDQKYPVDKLLTQENASMVTGPQMTDTGWVSLFRNSPPKNMEAEVMLGTVVKRAIEAGQWIDIPVRKDEPIVKEGVLEVDNVTVDFGGAMLEFGRGGKKL